MAPQTEQRSAKTGRSPDSQNQPEKYAETGIREEQPFPSGQEFPSRCAESICPPSRL